jgi:hypothetical protein
MCQSAWNEICDGPMFMPFGGEPAHETREMTSGVILKIYMFLKNIS